MEQELKYESKKKHLLIIVGLTLFNIIALILFIILRTG